MESTCRPHFLTTHTLSNPLQSVIYPRSLLIVSSDLSLSEILCLFPSLLPLKLMVIFNSFLKLDTPGFWASGCSWFSFHYSDALSLTCIFSFTYVRFIQDSSLGPCFIFTLLAPLNFPRFNFSLPTVSKILSTSCSTCAQYSLPLPSTVFAKSFIA